MHLHYSTPSALPYRLVQAFRIRDPAGHTVRTSATAHRISEGATEAPVDRAVESCACLAGPELAAGDARQDSADEGQGRRFLRDIDLASSEPVSVAQQCHRGGWRATPT